MPSTHRFQSRLFQALQSRLRQIQDGIQLRWRQLRVSASWNAQIALYPLQASRQVGRRVAQVFQQAVADVRVRSERSLQGEEWIPLDQPIRNVLSVLNSAALTSNALDSNGVDALTAGTLAIAPEALLASPMEQTAGAIVSSAPASLTLKQRLTARLQRWRGKVSLSAKTVDASTVQSSMVLIQGVASCLQQRHLVLVTANNQILDCLSPEQQLRLQERIQFEIAAAGSRQITQLRLFKTPFTPSVQRPLNAIRSGWASLQQSWQTAFALNPALDPPPMPNRLGPAVLSKMSLQWMPRLQSFWRSFTLGLGTVALVPFSSALPASAEPAPRVPSIPSPCPPQVGWIDPVQSRRHWLRNLDLFRQAKPTQGKIRLAPDKAPSAALAGSFPSAVADWSYRFTQTVPSSGRPAIDVNAAFTGYHYHPLERLLLILDQIMAWLEALILMLWRLGQSLFQQLFHSGRRQF